MLKKYVTLFISLLITSSLACGLFPTEPELMEATSGAVSPTPVILPTNKVAETAVSMATTTPTPQPITPSPTIIPTLMGTAVPPPATATAVPSPTSLPAPAILSFRANTETANPGDSIQLTWETQHSDWVTIYRLFGYQLSSFWEVAASGVMSYTIPESERNRISFMLFAGREGAENVQSDVTIALTCPDAWFFAPAPDVCPSQAALYSDAAEQPFEHGVMIWVKEQGRIYVLFADTISPKWNVYPDEWTEGDSPDPTLEPPPGMVQPVRGFGLVWQEQPDVRDRLGWATAPELAFITAYQTTSRYKYNDSFLRALDGDVWLLLTERSGWEKVAVSE